MVSRALGPLLRPAAALVGRLRYAQKFLVVGLVLLVPLGFVTAAYVALQRNQIAFSAKERTGVAYMAPLVGLAAGVAQSRHEAVTTGGDPGAVEASLAALDAVDKRLGSVLGLGTSWPDARRSVVAARSATGSAAARYAAYTTAMDALTALIVRVGDVSNLTLDPDLDTYYLMDTLQFRLPVLLDNAGRASDLAALASSADTGVLIDLGLTNGVLTSTRATVERAVTTIVATTADASARRLTAANFRRLDAATGALTAALTEAVKDRQPSRIGAGASDAVRVAAADFAAQAAVSLDRLLAVRINGFAARAERVEVASGLAVLLGAYLFVGFYLSVVPPIRRIVATLDAVAAGDLTRRVAVDTHDELSHVARALNETVSRTETATNGLAERATHDVLTGLPNRALVIDRLGQALTRSRREGTRLAVFFIDLDRFKLINDSLGHQAGDEVLRMIAGRLTALLRGADTVARLAGDEFVVICEAFGDTAAAIVTAERIVADLSRPIEIRTGTAVRDVGVGASVGIAYADGRADLTAEDLVRDADVAMYRAKQRGRGRVEVFDDALRIDAERRVQIQDELRHAIDDGQIRTRFQPIVDGETRAVLGFEALAHWAHPVRGALDATDFRAAGEQSGLIVPLGAEILRQACAQAARWPDHLRVAVDVAGPQLTHPAFVPTVAAALSGTGLDPDRLWLEINEIAIMTDANADAVAQTLRAVRELGVHLAIDDFGAGRSALAHLRHLPVEALKTDIGRDPEDEAIVEMILALAAALGLRVVAEGVDTAEQAARLRRMGCEHLQGLYFGPPMPAGDVGAFLEQPQAVLS